MKKLVVAMLTIFMCIAMTYGTIFIAESVVLPTATTSDEIEAKADDRPWWEYMSKSYTKTGSSSSGYDAYVGSAGELARVSFDIAIGEYIRGIYLQGNIDLSAHSWMPMGTNDNPFKGTFNGNGYKISGLTFSSNSWVIWGNHQATGLFGVTSGATIKNLKISGSTSSLTVTAYHSHDISSRQRYVGGVLGYDKGGNSSISNINSDINISLKLTVNWDNSCCIWDDNYARVADVSFGEIAGKCATVSNCIANGDISFSKSGLYEQGGGGNILGNYAIGGLVGEASSVTNCYSYGSLSISGDSSKFQVYRFVAGGVVGRCSGDVNNCNNHSTITQYHTVSLFRNYNTSAPLQGYHYSLGGVVGHADGQVQYCANYGDIDNYQYRINLGGVCGVVEGGLAFCANFGDIFSTKYSSTFGEARYHSIAGVVGFSYNSSVATNNCVNYGNISASANDSTKGAYYYVAGIVGRSWANTVSQCINYGTIDAQNVKVAAGIYAYPDASSGTVIAKNCAHLGSIIVYNDGNYYSFGQNENVNCKMYGASSTIYFPILGTIKNPVYIDLTDISHYKNLLGESAVINYLDQDLNDLKDKWVISSLPCRVLYTSFCGYEYCVLPAFTLGFLELENAEDAWVQDLVEIKINEPVYDSGVVEFTRYGTSIVSSRIPYLRGVEYNITDYVVVDTTEASVYYSNLNVVFAGNKNSSETNFYYSTADNTKLDGCVFTYYTSGTYWNINLKPQTVGDYYKYSISGRARDKELNIRYCEKASGERSTTDSIYGKLIVDKVIRNESTISATSSTSTKYKYIQYLDKIEVSITPSVGYKFNSIRVGTGDDSTCFSLISNNSTIQTNDTLGKKSYTFNFRYPDSDGDGVRTAINKLSAYSSEPVIYVLFEKVEYSGTISFKEGDNFYDNNVNLLTSTNSSTKLEKSGDGYSFSGLTLGERFQLVMQDDSGDGDEGAFRSEGFFSYGYTYSFQISTANIAFATGVQLTYDNLTSCLTSNGSKGYYYILYAGKTDGSATNPLDQYLFSNTSSTDSRFNLINTDEFNITITRTPIQYEVNIYQFAESYNYIDGYHQYSGNTYGGATYFDSEKSTTNFALSNSSACVNSTSGAGMPNADNVLGMKIFAKPGFAMTYLNMTKNISEDKTANLKHLIAPNNANAEAVLLDNNYVKVDKSGVVEVNKNKDSLIKLYNTEQNLAYYSNGTVYLNMKDLIFRACTNDNVLKNITDNAIINLYAYFDIMKYGLQGEVVCENKASASSVIQNSSKNQFPAVTYMSQAKTYNGSVKNPVNFHNISANMGDTGNNKPFYAVYNAPVILTAYDYEDAAVDEKYSHLEGYKFLGYYATCYSDATFKNAKFSDILLSNQKTYIFDKQALSFNNGAMTVADSSIKIVAKYIKFDTGTTPSSTSETVKTEKGNVERTNYVIKTAKELAWISNQLAKGVDNFENDVIKLANHIDMTGVQFLPIGTNKNPFKGTFDGCGYVLENLTLCAGNSASERIYSELGLFGVVDSAVIKNLSLVGGEVIGYSNVGAIAGKATNSTFENVNNFSCIANANSVIFYNIYGNKISDYYSSFTDAVYDEDNSYRQPVFERSSFIPQTHFAGVVGNSDRCTFVKVSNRANVIWNNYDGRRDISRVASLTCLSSVGTKFDRCYSEMGYSTPTNLTEFEAEQYYFARVDDDVIEDNPEFSLEATNCYYRLNNQINDNIYLINASTKDGSVMSGYYYDSDGNPIVELDANVWLNLYGKPVLRDFYWA